MISQQMEVKAAASFPQLRTSQRLCKPLTFPFIAFFLQNTTSNQTERPCNILVRGRKKKAKENKEHCLFYLHGEAAGRLSVLLVRGWRRRPQLTVMESFVKRFQAERSSEWFGFLSRFDFVLFQPLLRIAPRLGALSGQDEAFYPSCITIFLSISWWIEQPAQPSSNVSQKQTDNGRGRPDHRDNLILMKLLLLFQAAHKCLTLGSA